MADATTPTRLTVADIHPASQMLARAFFDDPMIVHLVPNADKREPRCARSMACILRYGLLCGEAYVTSANLEGAAVWFPPAAARPSLAEVVRSGFVWLPFSVGWKFFVHFWAYYRHISQLRQQHAPFRHWYLQLLGVDPNCRRQGHANRLLRPMLARLDKDNMPCGLDTINENNVTVYERFGFKVIAESRVPKTTIGCWLMMRGR